MGRKSSEFKESVHVRAMEETIRRICQLCKMGIYMTHPDEMQAYEGMYKCYSCGHCVKLKEKTEERLVNLNANT